MRTISRSVMLLAVIVAIASISSFDPLAQVQGRDPNVIMVDDCLPGDAGFPGGCPEDATPSAQSHQGDVSFAEFFALLFSPLAPAGTVFGHPSWRNEPPYLSVRAGQTIRVTNRGGRNHTFTHVENFGGGFVPPLNGNLMPAPECGANFVPNPSVVFVPRNHTQQVTGLDPGLHKFQCCIHPWMRAAVRVQ
jgi:plastocyanin